jgi:hypothetical protein
MKARLRADGGVANARDTTGYRRAWRLALDPNPSLSSCFETPAPEYQSRGQRGDLAVHQPPAPALSRRVGAQNRQSMRLPTSLLSIGLALAALLPAAGCGGPQVRTLGTGGGAAAYELRAGSTGQLRAQAERLCPGGYVVLREAFSTTAAAGDDAVDRALGAAGQWLAGEPFDQAQATIVCRG